MAGVCAAIGRATNTDPILWRVLLAVLGFFGGIGILVYVAAWLIIPAEGDTASPIESMLGRGRSSMSPVTVIILGILVAVMFGFIVTDEFRAVLLGAAILIGGAVLLNRHGTAPMPGSAAPPGSPGPSGFPGPSRPPGPWGPSPMAPAPQPTSGFPPPAYPQPAYPPPPYAPPAYPEPPAPVPPIPPVPGSEPPTRPMPTVPAPLPSMGGTATSGGYRAPFAPRGPYGGTGPYPPTPYPPGSYPPPAPPPRPPKPPKPPRERSPLGAATFSLIFLTIGVTAVLDLAHVIDVGVSAYFAGVLVTIALGLLVGAWFGRARWLIALGMVAAVALNISTLAESQNERRTPAVWSPTGYDTMATYYESNFGDATLDLSSVDFSQRDTQVTVRVNLGDLTVIVPPEVDVTVDARISTGDARVFDHRWDGLGASPRSVTDLDSDGPGGGKLRVHLEVNVGDVEVRR